MKAVKVIETLKKAGIKKFSKEKGGNTTDYSFYHKGKRYSFTELDYDKECRGFSTVIGYDQANQENIRKFFSSFRSLKQHIGI